jgi:hypothetical protein
MYIDASRHLGWGTTPQFVVRGGRRYLARGQFGNAGSAWMTVQGWRNNGNPDILARRRARRRRPRPVAA